MGLLQSFNSIMESVDMDTIEHTSVKIPLVRGFEKEQLEDFECSMSPECPCDDCQKNNIKMD